MSLQAVVDQDKVDARAFVAEIIQRETALMKQECWNVNLAINHILKVVRAEAKQYLNGSTLERQESSTGTESIKHRSAGCR